jgi:hypothetical protein
MAKVAPKSAVRVVARADAKEVVWAELAGRECVGRVCVGRVFLAKCMMASA